MDIKTICSEKNKLSKKMDKSKDYNNKLYHEYEKFEKRVTTRFSNAMEDIGMIVHGWTDAFHGPFECSTVYMCHTFYHEIRVYFNILGRRDELGFESSKHQYMSTGNVIKTVNVKKDDCYCIKDYVNKEIYTCSTLERAIDIVKKLQKKIRKHK